MVLMIDNYDSFTYNLFQIISELGANVSVHRNDSITVHQALQDKYGSIIISPGPGGPADAGISIELVQQNRGRTPVLGVCLGHQVIAAAFRGKIIRSPRLMHGKTSEVYHDGKSVFAGIPNPFSVVRYHSLAVDKQSLPSCMEVSAWTTEGEIMAIRHKDLPVEGVQFHPESMLTEHGSDLLHNWLRMVEN